MDRRLEDSALTDLHARAEYARVLERRGDARGSLLRHTVTPSTLNWRLILALFNDRIATADWDPTTRWLEPFLAHWPTELRSNPLEWHLAHHPPQLCQTLTLYGEDVAHLDEHAVNMDLRNLSLHVDEFAVLQRLDHLTTLQRLTIRGQRQLAFGWYIDFEWMTLPEQLQHLTLANIMPETLAPIQPLQALRSLTLDRCRVRRLTFLNDLHALESLTLSETKIRRVDPLSTLRSIQTLDLSGNKISDVTPLAACQQLRRLDLGRSPKIEVWDQAVATTVFERKRLGNKVRDASALASLTHLTHLDCSFNPLRQIDFVVHLPNLTHLGLRQTHIKHADSVALLPQLEVLDLQSTRVHDITFCKHLRSLEMLNVIHTSVDDLSPLLGLRQLRRLDVSRRPVFRAQLDALHARNPQLNIYVHP